VLLLVAGEHAREIITSEIALWLVGLLTGDRLEGLLTRDNLEFAEWAATQPIQVRLRGGVGERVHSQAFPPPQRGGSGV